MAATTLPTVNIDMTLSPVINAIEDLSILPKIKRKDDHIENAYTKILDPSKKRLNSLDAQRIVSVLDDTIRKCEMVTLLPFIIENLDRYSVMLGGDLLDALKVYDMSQQFYTKALSKSRKLRPNSAKSGSTPCSHDSTKVALEQDHNLTIVDYDSVVEDVGRLSSEVSNCVKTIGRIFKSNPIAISTLKSQRSERSYEANSFIDNLLCLREEVFNRLVTMACEEQDKQKTCVQILKKETKTRANIKKLEAELNNGTNEMKDMIQSKNEVIRNLKSAIQAIEQESELAKRKMVNDAKKNEIADMKNSEITQSKLQQDIIALKQEIQSNTQKHREDELLMRKRKFKIETEVENWVQKYDNDMSEKQSELDEIGAIYAEEKSQLEQLEERFETLEIEYKRIIEERRIAQEKREEEERELIRRTKAATLIQSYWRSFKVRKSLKAKQKKGKKGKGGKKKRK